MYIKNSSVGEFPFIKLIFVVAKNDERHCCTSAPDAYLCMSVWLFVRPSVRLSVFLCPLACPPPYPPPLFLPLEIKKIVLMAHLRLYLKSSGTFTGCWSLINSLHIRLIYIINKIDHGKVSWRLYILRYVIIIFCEFTRFLNRNQCHLINLKPSSTFPIIGISWSQSKMLVLN